MDANEPMAQGLDAASPRHFEAVLVPHRSLSPRGFVVLMTLVSLFSFAAGVAFWMIGAWPVFGFFGLDVLLIYGAFKLNYRSANRSETIRIFDDRLDLIRKFPSGRMDVVTLNPYWARSRIEEESDGRASLYLGSHGREVSIGAFLSDDERRAFAGLLSRALADAREPRFARD